MMKKYIFGLTILIFGLNFTACTTVRKATSATAGIEADVFQYPAVADLQVKDKVEKTVTWPFRIIEQPVKERKSNLVADILRTENADVMIEMQSTYTKKPFGERTLTVSGYPATYTNFRNATDEDIKAFDILSQDKNICCADSQKYYKKPDRETIQRTAKRERDTRTPDRQVIVRAAYSIDGNFGEGLLYDHGYSFGLEYRSFMKKNFFWNVGLDFATMSYDAYVSKYDYYNGRISYDESGAYKALQVPLGVGYRFNMGKHAALTFNTSLLLSFSVKGETQNTYYHNEKYSDDSEKFQAGFLLRTELWLSKLKIEVAYKPYFTMKNDNRFQSMTFGLGYAF